MRAVIPEVFSSLAPNAVPSSRRLPPAARQQWRREERRRRHGGELSAIRNSIFKTRIAATEKPASH